MRRFGWLVVCLALAGVALPARAKTPLLTEAGTALRKNKVFVHPDADPTITKSQANLLRSMIKQGPSVYIAILPPRARHEVIDIDELPLALGRVVGRDGAYGVIAGRNFRGSSRGNSFGFRRATTIRLATQAFDRFHPSTTGGAVLPMLVEWVRLLQENASVGPGLPYACATSPLPCEDVLADSPDGLARRPSTEFFPTAGSGPPGWWIAGLVLTVALGIGGLITRSGGFSSGGGGWSSGTGWPGSIWRRRGGFWGDDPHDGPDHPDGPHFGGFGSDSDRGSSDSGGGSWGRSSGRSGGGSW